MRSLLRVVLAAGLTLGLIGSATSAEYKTLTDSPRDTNREGYSELAPDTLLLDGGNVTLWLKSDEWDINKKGAMGADVEFFSNRLDARIGVWANGDLAQKAPRSIVTDMVNRMKEITGGTWTPAEKVDLAGIPVYMSEGRDEYGNYYYKVYALERWGQKYAFAVRTDYDNRWNEWLNAELAYAVTHIHPTQWGPVR